MEAEAKFGYKPVDPQRAWRQTNASRYVRKFQSRRSLLIWKVFGRRTATAGPTTISRRRRCPATPSTLHWKGKPVADTPQNRNRADLDFSGSVMPPPEAVAGTYDGPDGKKIKVDAADATRTG